MKIPHLILAQILCHNPIKGYMTPMSFWYRWGASHANNNLWKFEGPTTIIKWVMTLILPLLNFQGLFLRGSATQWYQNTKGVIYSLRFTIRVYKPRFNAIKTCFKRPTSLDNIWLHWNVLEFSWYSRHDHDRFMAKITGVFRLRLWQGIDLPAISSIHPSKSRLNCRHSVIYGSDCWLLSVWLEWWNGLVWYKLVASSMG